MKELETDATRPAWFVGALWNGTEDQVDRFLDEGVWINGYEDKFIAEVKSIQPGDRIAIKAAFTKKYNLPFDSQGHVVSVNRIKAIGRVTENRGDGRHLKVQWEPDPEPRDWYFFTSQLTLWKVEPTDYRRRALLDFAFQNVPQDYDRFCNLPQYAEKFGVKADESQFLWTAFYEEFSERLLQFKDDRRPLIEGIHKIARQVDNLSYLNDRFEDGRSAPLTDICPFTVMGMFNRGITERNRTKIAQALGELIGVEAPAPTSFDGIPILNNMKSWFFGYSTDRGDDDFDILWATFSAAASLREDQRERNEETFCLAFNRALQVKNTSWNLTTGLYWARPFDFVTLDARSRSYIANTLGIPAPDRSTNRPLTGEIYLKLVNTLMERFAEQDYPVHSFPELSYQAYRDEPEPAATTREEPDSDDEDAAEIQSVTSPVAPYSISTLMNDGCFLPEQQVAMLLHRLRQKKNLILQGPPGTGKTWLAKRLGYALMGEKASTRIRATQFHPNLSYEDFVRGWRPTGDGNLQLTDGVFMQAVKAARLDPTQSYVVVIEEINRGNPAQIFGELLTLLEAGMRTPAAALELCYPDPDREGRSKAEHIPENLYVIGTMNIADRSLALVDLALRRRFAFVTLEPQLGDVWKKWVAEKSGIDVQLVTDIQKRLKSLNDRIADAFGTQFRIGHSYVTPPQKLEDGTTRDWFRQVAETEIGPLLEEYWFDQPSRAEEELKTLLLDW